MDKKTKSEISRRNFLSSTIPAAICLISIQPLLSAFSLPDDSTSKKSENDDFDDLMNNKLTYREYITLQYKELIKLMKHLSKKIGENNLIKFIDSHAEESGTAWGKWMLKNSDDNSFSTFIKYLEDPFYDNTLKFEFIERTDKVCEIKVTKCLWAEVFNKENSGDIGHSYICKGDYHHCKAFNSKIIMKRDKTLMQGDSYCNHRYILTS